MIVIDYNDKRPLYEQIVERFQTLILQEVLKANEKLPSVRGLAVELSINPNTIQRAYAELERGGFIYTVKGRGNFVKENEVLLERQKEKLLGELKEQVKSCVKYGIASKDIVVCVEQAVKEGSYD